MTASGVNAVLAKVPPIWMAAAAVLGWLGFLVVTPVNRIAALEVGAAKAEVADSLQSARIARQEFRFDSLLIELRHLPGAVADTLEARERRDRR